jgi:methionyl aminopeptidase
MIVIKNKQAVSKMAQAGELLAPIVREACANIAKPGVTTGFVDAWIEQAIRSAGMVPRVKGYRGYQHATCISINDVIVHGIPSSLKMLQEGDLVTIDVCASWSGYCVDMARSFFVGGVNNAEAKNLHDVAYVALDAGIKKALPGNRLSDISAAIQQVVESHGFSVIRDFAGHGIGKSMHEDPEILNFGKPGQGPVLQVGMALAIEPMISAGDYRVAIDKDGWTARTKDGSLAAHVEDTVIVAEGGPQIVTRPVEMVS